MAKGFNVLHVKSAVKDRNKFDLSRTHLTTMDFGEIIPLFSEEVVPGDQISVNANYFSRLAPLVVPTYGKFKFKTMTAFVPYHQIAEDADAWIAGKTTWEGVTTRHRYFTVKSFVTLLTYISDEVQTEPEADFAYVDSAGTTKYCSFTYQGRYYVKVLNSLGYAIPEGVNLSQDSDWTTNVGNTKLSAYPLLAFFKAYNDYMSQSQRYNSSQLSTYLKTIKHNTAHASYYNSTGELTALGVKELFDHLKLNYENDYFTSAWQNANRPINTVENVSGVSVPGDPGGAVFDNQKYNYLKSYDLNTGNSSYDLNQRALDFLKSFDDWVRRNNYSGSRAVQEVYSRFGIKTDDYKSNYAHVLSTDEMPIQVGDVTATAQSNNVPLGDYAGKGIMSGSGSVTCKADDYGLLMIIGYFTVVPMNAYGYDRKVLRSEPLDYYTPEFDGIGAEAISLGEVFCDPLVDPEDESTEDTEVFGFTERYNSYRYGRDLITGDFRDFHSNGDMNAWHTGRNLSAIRQDGNMIAQTSAMNTLPQTNSEYNRIFSVTDSSVNHFYLTCQFKVNAVRPMLSLNQVVKLGVGDTTVPRNGNVIS